jgi:hypothetical protein
MVRLTSIHWQDARALRAGVAPFKVAAIQPAGELTTFEPKPLFDSIRHEHNGHAYRDELKRHVGLRSGDRNLTISIVRTTLALCFSIFALTRCELGGGVAVNIEG